MSKLEALREAYEEKERAQSAYFKAIREDGDHGEAVRAYRDAVRVFRKWSVELATAVPGLPPEDQRSEPWENVLVELQSLHERWNEGGSEMPILEALNDLMWAYEAWRECGDSEKAE